MDRVGEKYQRFFPEKQVKYAQRRTMYFLPVGIPEARTLVGIMLNELDTCDG